MFERLWLEEMLQDINKKQRDIDTKKRDFVEDEKELKHNLNKIKYQRRYAETLWAKRLLLTDTNEDELDYNIDLSNISMNLYNESNIQIDSQYSS